MELVQVKFLRKAFIPGGALYLAGEIAGVSPEIAKQLCEVNDNPTATLHIQKVVDAPPSNKMATRPEHKKEKHG